MSLQDIWRILFVRCFNITLLLFTSLQVVFAAEYRLDAIDSKEYTTGDIVRLKVENLEYKKALELKNSRISNLLYVLNVFKKDYEVYFEVILSEDKNYIAKEDTFKLQGLNYRPVKLNLSKDIDVIDNRIVLIKDKLIIFISIAAIIIFLFFISKILIKRRNHKREIIFQKNKLNINTEKLSREHFENFYLLRKDFKTLYSYEAELYEDFENSLNSIQYKKYWSDEEYENIASKYKVLIINVKDSDGI